MRLMIFFLAVIAGLAIQVPVYAGFFDNIVNKAKQSAEQAVGDTVDQVVDEQLGGEQPPAQAEASEAAAAPADKAGTAPSVNAAAGKAADAGSSAAGDDLPTSARKMALAAVRYAPDFFDKRPEHQAKQFMRYFRPDDSELLTNKFYWHKNKDAFAAEIAAEAQNAQTTFTVAPWIDNRSYADGSSSRHNNLTVDLLPYDFDRQAWQIYYPSGYITVPFLAGGEKHIMGYRVIGLEPGQQHRVWVEMPPDEAEQLDNQLKGSYRLYGSYTFTVTDVVGVDPEDHPDYAKNKKYIDMGGSAGASAVGNMVPQALIKIKDDKIDLYAYLGSGSPRGNLPKDEFLYITSINIAGGG